MRAGSENGAIVISALELRTKLGKVLRRIETEQRSLVIEKRGTAAAVLLNIRDYVKLAAPEPEVLRAIAQDAQRRKTSGLTSRQIDRIIRAARASRAKG
jgi:prevent-host-death family protein